VSTLLRSKTGVVGLAVALAVVIGAGGWFLLVGPKRSTATELDGKIAGVQTEIQERRALLAAPEANVKFRASDLFRLTKAMPDSGQTAGVLLEINRLAGLREIAFTSIRPDAPVALTGYTVHPFTVTLEGRFGNISRFLGDVRRLVQVRKHRLDARGRLFAVDSVSLGKPETKEDFPNVKATVTINAFVYGGSAPDVPGAETGSTTTPEQTTPPSSNGTVAAGATG
jgi:Tfp pilus assembly protein PilO